MFVVYLDSREKLFKERLQVENDACIRQAVSNKLKRIESFSAHQREVLQARKHTGEEILQMKCPRCRKEFYDFVGCFAIRCSCGMLQCPCNFCGLCLLDWGDSDATHAHVATYSQKPPGAGIFFGKIEEFNTANNKQRRHQVSEYLQQAIRSWFTH